MSSYDESTRLIDLLGVDYDNFNEPMPWSNRKPALMGLTITFMILSWIFVSFRLYVRLRIVHALGWDDLFVFLYLICASLGSVAFLISIQHGTGQHMLFLTVGQMGHYLGTFYILNAAFNLAACFIKLSLLFQYLRIFEKGTWPRFFSKITIVFVALWGLAFALLAFIPCAHVSDFWYSPPDAQCWAYGSNHASDFVGTFESHTALNMILDLVILTIPIWLYFQDVALRMRCGLLALLFMGALVNFLSIWRLQTIIQHKAGWYPTHDPTWYGPITILLAVLEVNCASICASVPIFWPVLSQRMGSIFITQEVTVEHEYRGDKKPAEGLSVAWRTNRTNSETELRPLDSQHYQDSYVKGQVDPLREAGEARTKTQIHSDSVMDRRGIWDRV